MVTSWQSRGGEFTMGVTDGSGVAPDIQYTPAMHPCQNQWHPASLRRIIQLCSFLSYPARDTAQPISPVNQSQGTVPIVRVSKKKLSLNDKLRGLSPFELLYRVVVVVKYTGGCHLVWWCVLRVVLSPTPVSSRQICRSRPP